MPFSNLYYVMPPLYEALTVAGRIALYYPVSPYVTAIREDDLH
jgi:hypothetical protein